MNEDILNSYPELQELVASINTIKTLDDSVLSDEAMPFIIDSIKDSFTAARVNTAVNEIISNYEAEYTTRQEVLEGVNTLKEIIKELFYGDQVIGGNRKILYDEVINQVNHVFDEVSEKYHSYAIKLPIMLEAGAQAPTYAHDSDAAADLYAIEDVELSPHSTSTPIKTGVHIQLPEGWVAMVLPRSSIGAKTTLRLSNSQGVIDSGYRGEVRAIYDNIGNEPYQIHKGDRIAQIYVMPSYRFKAQIVDSLEDSDRGNGGFGSTGV